MKSSDRLLVEFITARDLRDRLKRERDGCFCERAEPMTPRDYEDAAAEAQTDPLATFEFPQPTQAEPCWKAARKWTPETPYSNGGKFYHDPPMSEWCATCQRRQKASEDYREAVRRHAGALRGLIRRGKSLAAKTVTQ